MSTKIVHLNCGLLHAPPNPPASCHCLLVESDNGLTLVDTGIGLLDIQDSERRIGKPAIEIAGFQFLEPLTAARQIERLGHRVADVRQIILTHADPDHVGGLADFPEATVHMAEEEFQNLRAENPRYSPPQFEHPPRWQLHPSGNQSWFGLESRPISTRPGSEIHLIPLPGHTLGHCGVATQVGDRWILHVGDAYYLRVELETDDHPVSQLATLRADDDSKRRKSLEHLRRLQRDHAHEVSLFGYHDFTEFPADSGIQPPA